MWDNIYQPDQTGSEGGLIIADEEYRDSCRITLEKCERYYAITCGVYGGMMHTASCNSTQYQETYNNICRIYLSEKRIECKRNCMRTASD